MAEIYKTEDGRRAVEKRYREFLARWPVPAEHLYASTAQGETFVIACGPSDAPPLVLLHGSVANSAMWLTDVADYARHFRVYAIDLIGEPGLSAPSRPSMTSDAYARWLEEVLNALDIQRTRMVAVSLGGWMALDYATRHPDKVERLALQCPSGIGPQLWGKLMVAMLLKPLGHWGRAKAIRLLLGPTSPFTPPLAPTFTTGRPVPAPTFTTAPSGPAPSSTAAPPGPAPTGTTASAPDLASGFPAAPPGLASTVASASSPGTASGSTTARTPDPVAASAAGSAPRSRPASGVEYVSRSAPGPATASGAGAVPASDGVASTAGDASRPVPGPSAAAGAGAAASGRGAASATGHASAPVPESVAGSGAESIPVFGAASTSSSAGGFGDFMLLINSSFRPRQGRLPIFDDETLRRLTMPLLVIVGGRDAFLDSSSTRRRITETAPHATVRFLPDGGHYLPNQTEAIIGFLTENAHA